MCLDWPASSACFGSGPDGLVLPQRAKRRTCGLGKLANVPPSSQMSTLYSRRGADPEPRPTLSARACACLPYAPIRSRTVGLAQLRLQPTALYCNHTAASRICASGQRRLQRPRCVGAALKCNAEGASKLLAQSTRQPMPSMEMPGPCCSVLAMYSSDSRILFTISCCTQHCDVTRLPTHGLRTSLRCYSLYVLTARPPARACMASTVAERAKACAATPAGVQGRGFAPRTPGGRPPQ